VADVEDARRVCQQLGITHHVFNFTADFERDVVAPYVEAHAQARTPNPCIACNAHLKFGRFLERAPLLGFDAIATGHHARVTKDGTTWQLRRGRDVAKDQSYVLYMLGQEQLARVLLPIGELTKEEVRRLASDLDLRTAGKPDSQDVCFISKSGGRASFVGERIPLREGRLVGTNGDDLGEVEALELVTVGQRRGLGLHAVSLPERRYVVAVDLAKRVAMVGPLEDLLVERLQIDELSWSYLPLVAGSAVQVQLSAHGRPLRGQWLGGPDPECGTVMLEEPTRRVAPGQAVVLYAAGPADDAGGAGRPEVGQSEEVVVGGGTAV
jgi:tRNA-specific 2-thiouridylase